MPYTAWPTVTDSVNIAEAMNQTIGATVSTELQTVVRDAVVERVKRFTQRTWIPETETRSFDGNGTGILEVDDYITLNSIVIVGWFGQTTGLTLENFNAVEKNTFPNNRIQIYRGSIPNYVGQWANAFPIGRSNIEINAVWGYDTTIPPDLWLAVAYQQTGILLNWKQFESAGYLVKWQEADVTEVRMRLDPFEFFKHSGLDFDKVLKRYKRPSGIQLRKQAKRLI